MSNPALLTRMLAIVAFGLLTALTVLSIGWLQPGGLRIFDSRLLGYDVADAQTYIDSLTPAARGLYLGVFRVLDTLFPVFASAAMIGAVLVGKGRAWVPALAIPVAFLALDLTENALVGQMLREGPALAETASRITMAKWGSFFTGLLLALAAWRARHRKGDDR
ncbi:hypothetical protein [Sulfitobacter sp. S190]|uniref:hypothetical protein n=1 Tax=Sulfitobacter sp. S190 TaxID=2867022 RepID=UPI0021A7E83B|nr:hypothetical protein [Sulfitobacter sp. S190]UWR23267.1 hypothetical protein K3756_04550 [Sulfitobacter sp. S190]